jgi:anti-sigma B factor antagonist
MMGPLRIRERQVADVTVLELAGQLVADEDETPFKDRVDALIRAGQTKLLVNLHQVAHVDSGSIGVLVAKYASVRRRGGDLKLVALSERARRVLTTTRLLSVFEVFESEDDALGSFGASAPAV